MKKKIITLLSVTALLFAFKAQAQEERRSVLTDPRPVEEPSEWKPHFGVLLGASQPEGSGVTASEFGIDVGYQPFIPYSLAAELSYASIDDGTETKDRTTLWGKFSYNFGGDNDIIRYSYIGAGLGVVAKPDRTSLAIAPIVGFDIPIQVPELAGFSLGAAAKYAVVSDGEVDTLSLSAVAKYWY